MLRPYNGKFEDPWNQSLRRGPVARVDGVVRGAYDARKFSSEVKSLRVTKEGRCGHA